MDLSRSACIPNIPGYTNLEGEFVRVEAGTFQMGAAHVDGIDDVDAPLHPVTLTEYLIARDPVTNERGDPFIAEEGGRSFAMAGRDVRTGRVHSTWTGPSADAEMDRYDPDVDLSLLRAADLRMLPQAVRVVPLPQAQRYQGLNEEYGLPTHPAVRWSHHQAERYAAWMTKQYNMLAHKPFGEGEFRIATSAQWEGAARYIGAGQGWRTDAEAPFATMSGQIPAGRRISQTTLAVEAAEALPNGARGMFGNVGEWVADWRGANFLAGQAVTNPTGPTTGISRSIRGGWFSNVLPYSLRVARPDYSLPFLGDFSSLSFRVVFVPRIK